VNLSAVSRALFAVGRRSPQVPVAFLKALPPAALERIRAMGFRDTIRTARRSAFYRDAFARAGVDPRRVRTPADLRDFFLTPRTLKTQPEALLCGEPDLAIESSGTSGHVTRVYLSRAELEHNARQGGLLYALYGLRRGDRLLCTLDLAFGLGSLLVERGVRHIDLFAMVVGRVDAREAYDRLAAYRFNVVVSDPFWLGRLTEIARERGRPAPLKALMGGGEGITARARRELETFWDAPLYMTYGSTEAATTLGFECRHRDGYHVNEFDFHVEVDAPDADGYGEVVITTLHRHVMPLVRYRTGDVARWLPERCACGLPFRRLSTLRGRLDEQVSCVWGNVHPEFFERLLAGVRGLGPDWQVALYERDLKPVFQFRIELAPELTARDEAAETVLRVLREAHPDAWTAFCQRLVDVEFCYFPPGELRRHRKLLRLVDERAEGPPAWARHPVRASR
jgi:phenylacetate-CoA ligase